MRTPRAKPRPIAGSPSRKGRYPRPSRPVEPSTSPPPAHAALDGASPRKGPPRASKRPSSTPPAEPAQTEGATLPRVEEDPASGPGWLKCIDGLHGRVSRWRRMAGGPVLDCVRRFDGTIAAAHPRTVERHRGCAVEWVRERARSADRG